MKIPRNKLSALGRASRVKLSGPEGYPLHDHDFGEIFWVDKGHCVHEVNGHRFPLAKNTLVFIRPWDQHSFHVQERKFLYVNNACFQWHIYEYLKQRYFRNDASVYGEDEKYPKAILLSEGQLQHMRHLFLTLFQASDALLHIEQYLLGIFIEFAAPANRNDANNLPSWMKNAWNLIQQPEHFRLGAAEFCRLSGRCREHVSRVFHKSTGKTLNQCIRELRMKHAAFLLEGSSHEIIEIALECGFESLSHFYSAFRSIHGVTPLAFRKRAQGKMYA